MKSKFKLAGLMLTVPLIASCWVRSVYPFYEDTDVIVDQSLAGNWIGVGELKSCVLSVSFDQPTGSYSFQVSNLRPADSQNRCTQAFNGEAMAFSGQLIQIGSTRFLDFVYSDQDGLEMLLKVERDKRHLLLTPLDSEWVGNAIDQKSVKLHGRLEVFGGLYGAGPPPDARITLVSPTSDLREFLRDHGGDKGAFSQSGQMIFERK